MAGIVGLEGMTVGKAGRNRASDGLRDETSGLMPSAMAQPPVPQPEPSETHETRP